MECKVCFSKLTWLIISHKLSNFLRMCFFMFREPSSQKSVKIFDRKKLFNVIIVDAKCCTCWLFLSKIIVIIRLKGCLITGDLIKQLSLYLLKVICDKKKVARRILRIESLTFNTCHTNKSRSNIFPRFLLLRWHNQIK